MTSTDAPRETPPSAPGPGPAAGSGPRELHRRAQRGWPAGFPLVQFPNAPLWVAGGALLVSAITDGSGHAYAKGAFYAGLSAWAWLELASGDNVVRRAIGVAGLAYVVERVGAELGG